MMAKRAREASSLVEGWPPEVLPDHTIFLSHSGHDKPFVERLCKKLEDLNYTPFFDQNSDSLPKGERFPPHLFKAAEQCLLAVIVLSEGYLTSKWPMLELATFVKARETKNPNMKLLPLFYKLSPSDLVPEKWMESWKKLAEDGKIHTKQIELWSKGVKVLMKAKNVGTDRMKSSTCPFEHDEIMSDDSSKLLDEVLQDFKSLIEREKPVAIMSEDFPKLLVEVVQDLRPFNGLEFIKYGTSEESYIEAVVDEIWEIIPLVVKYKTDWIRGYRRICDKASSLFVEGIVTLDFCDPRSWYLGLHGMGGVGKTTLCVAMCGYYQAEFRGRVCHVELLNDTPHDRIERLKHVIRTLGGCDDRVLEKITTEAQGWGCLRKRLASQPPAFLAVDNVGDSESSREEARGFISCGLACGSKVMVTSRSRLILESILGEAKYCKPIPRLEEQEAEELFLSVAIPRKMPSPLPPCVDLIVKECIRDCKFSDDGYDTQQYHPLVLRALGIFFQDFDMKDWKDASMVQKKLQESRESKRMNDILGLNYAKLSDGQKMLFLDVAILFNYESLHPDFLHPIFWSEVEYQWAITLLAALHGITSVVFNKRVKELQRMSLIYESSSSVRTHDLYIEFAQSLVSTEGSKEKEWWVGPKDANGYRSTLKRLVSPCDISRITDSPQQLWKCPNLECLIMRNWEGTLNSKLDLKCFPNLRVLIIRDLNRSTVLCAADDAVDFDVDLYGPKNQNEGCLPELRMVHLCEFDFRRIPFLRECWNLTYLRLDYFNLDFDNPHYVASLFENLKALETLILYSTFYDFAVSVYSQILQCAASMKSLKYLKIERELARMVGYGMIKLDLSALGSLTVLFLPHLPSSTEELVGLDQLSQLTTLNLKDCIGLRKLANLDLLPNLRQICVGGCVHLEHLEDRLKRFQKIHAFPETHQKLRSGFDVPYRKPHPDDFMHYRRPHPDDFMHYRNPQPVYRLHHCLKPGWN